MNPFKTILTVSANYSETLFIKMLSKYCNLWWMCIWWYLMHIMIIMRILWTRKKLCDIQFQYITFWWPLLLWPCIFLWAISFNHCLQQSVIIIHDLVFVFITAPLVKRGRDQQMAIHHHLLLLLFFSHLLDQSEQSRCLQALLWLVDNTEASLAPPWQQLAVHCSANSWTSVQLNIGPSKVYAQVSTKTP